VWTAVGRLVRAVQRSPNVQRYVSGSPSGSEPVAASNVTVRGARPDAGVAARVPVDGGGAFTYRIRRTDPPPA